MKKTTLITLLLLCFNISKAQTVILSNQNQVDNFSITYPADNSFDFITVNGSDITNLNGLSQITTILGSVFITTTASTNYPLTDISGLNNITDINQKLTLSNLKFVNASNLFPNLEHLGTDGGNQEGLSITGQTPNIINGFNSLLDIKGDLYINNTSLLVNLNGFENLISVKGTTSGNQATFYFLNNSALTTINGFGDLTEIGSDYFFSNNPNLTSLPNTSSLTKIGTTLTILNCNSLSDFTGLNFLTELVNGALNINQNTNLISLSGLDNLTKAKGIFIQNCPSLINLNALSSITEFNSASIVNRPKLTISNNNSITSIIGLENINGTSIGDVRLENNPNLSVCAIESLCEKIAFDTNLTGFLQVNNNASGCNSVEEINTVCQALDIEESNLSNTILFYPNPVKSVINFNTINPTEIIIYDILGRTRIHTIVNNSNINISYLEEGIYFIHAIMEDKTYSSKFIKE